MALNCVNVRIPAKFRRLVSPFSWIKLARENSSYNVTAAIITKFPDSFARQCEEYWSWSLFFTRWQHTASFWYGKNFWKVLETLQSNFWNWYHQSLYVFTLYLHCVQTSSYQIKGKYIKIQSLEPTKLSISLWFSVDFFDFFCHWKWRFSSFSSLL